jgi:hypothetical protein
MNAEQHVPVEDLAAYAAGDLDATAAVAVETHLVLCAECRADVAAVNDATAALAALDHPAMPADVAARVDSALAAAAIAPGGDVLPLVPKKRRPSIAGLSAVAAGIALIAAITVPLVSRPHADKASTEAGKAAPTVATRRLSSGLDYTHTTLAATLRNALAGRGPRLASGGDTPALTGGGGVSGAPGAVLAPPAATPAPTGSGGGGEFALDARTQSEKVIESDPGRLAACVTSLATGLPAEAATPVVVDFARYSGQPAVVVAFPTVTEGRVRTDKIDVYVVGPQCGLVPGDDHVLDFGRIPRPKGV